MADTLHDKIAKALAGREGVEYNPGAGADVKGKQRVVEVAVTQSDVYSSVKQLSRYEKPRYIATIPSLKSTALTATQGTGIGVMTGSGEIIKRARGKS